MSCRTREAVRAHRRWVDQKYAAAYAALLLVTWAVRHVRRGEGATVLVSAMMIATGGVLGEAALSAIGEFSYLQPDLLGVPWWLFPLYLHGALAARDVAAVSTARGSVRRRRASSLR